jgi:hypothetical protein
VGRSEVAERIGPRQETAGPEPGAVHDCDDRLLVTRPAPELEPAVEQHPPGGGGLALAQEHVAVVEGHDGARVVQPPQLLVAQLGEQVQRSQFVDGHQIVDARDGSLLVREDLVDAADDNPEWEVFPNTPPVDYSSTDTRVRWCFAPGPGCDEVVGTSASPLAWDIDPTTRRPSETTSGNNSFAVHNWFSNNPFRVGNELATPRPARDYAYAWENQWLEEKCSPAVFETQQRNDIDAARANLFAMHNRMHDWSYHLGFTESTFNLQDDNFDRGGKLNDPEQGNAQAGGVSGGPPTFAARDNANQITPPDGHRPITNMYLWQPIAGSFYAPCVDGDFDMTLIGHEYTHAITNRMIAGPKDGLNSPQGMSESWSDLLAMEYLNEHGYAPSGVRAFTIGQYVTSDPVAGIRNYNMSASPLNYSSVDYDFVGLQVHASGEVWSAANFDIRAAMIGKYGAGTASLQKSCANGSTPVTQCPGNRRWVQLVFDSYLLMAQSQVSMVDARDALLAADFIRFSGTDLDLMWNAFAKRGLGENAISNGFNDPNPTPSFASPFATEATATFRPVDEAGQPIADAQLFAGHYQARAVPVADTSAGTPLPNTVALVPGTYEFVARAAGRGLVRAGPVTVSAGQQLDLAVTMPTNLASAAAGATATGNGVNIARLIDDDEATNWVSSGAPVAGRGVVVDLAGAGHRVSRVQVSAMLRPPIPATLTRAPRTGSPHFASSVCSHAMRSGPWTAPTRPTTRRSSPAPPTRSPRSHHGRGRPSSSWTRSTSPTPTPRICASRWSPTSAQVARTTPVNRMPTRERARTARGTARRPASFAPRSSRRSRTSGARPRRSAHARLAASAAGVPVKVVNERLGHATPSLTVDVYVWMLHRGAQPGPQRCGRGCRSGAMERVRRARHLGVSG